MKRFDNMLEKIARYENLIELINSPGENKFGNSKEWLLTFAKEEIDKVKEALKADAKNTKEQGTWIKVGEIGVDAGICWIGDPCYVFSMPHSKNTEFPDLNKPKDLPKELGDTWSEFCDNLYTKFENSEQPAAQFNYDAGHPGLGVCTHTGYGDGSYEVFIKKNLEGRVMEAKVVFIQEEDDGAFDFYLDDPNEDPKLINFEATLKSLDKETKDE